MPGKQLFTIILLFSLSVQLLSQQKTWCLSGQVVEEQTNSPIPAVHITTPTYEIGTITDENGFFELCNIEADTIELLIFHTSFQKLTLSANKQQSEKLKIKLTTKDYQTQEITVTGKGSAIVKSYIPGKLTLKKSDIISAPTILGSPDVIRSLQLMPGIQSVNEGNQGIYVRGGSPGQNYILFDDIELMNPSHLMGIYSVFNPLLTDQVEFYKGNAPIHQSGRLASSIIVTTRNQKEPKTNWAGNLGNIATNLTYNGQSPNGKWYFSSGIRRSYIDVLKYVAQPFMSDEENYFEKNNYTFYDFNGKIRFRSGKNRLTLTWYKGQDVFTFNNKGIQSKSKWGNEGAVFSWQFYFSPSLVMKNSVAYSGYSSLFAADFEGEHLQFKTDYKHYNFKNDFLLNVDNHLVRWGLSTTRYEVAPQDLDLSIFSDEQTAYNKYRSIGSRLFASDHYKFSEKWSLYGGVSLEHYALLGPYSYQHPDYTETVEDGKIADQQLSLNAVFSINYFPISTASFKGSYAYGTQNMHLASITSIPLPSDIWMPSTRLLPPERGHQVTLGYFKEYPESGVQYGIEAYGKQMDNQLLLKINVDNEDIPNFEDNFYTGEGLAYGAEFYLKGSKGKLNTTLSYTLGWARQRFPNVNDGEWYDAQYDRRHDLNVLCTYQLNEFLDLGAVFIFATGNKATLPTGRYWLMGDIANDYEGINNFRMPAYHRMDFSLNYHFKSELFHESILNFSIINVYNRSNPYFIFYSVEEGSKDYELSIKAKQVSLFPILPSISWRFKF